MRGSSNSDADGDGPYCSGRSYAEQAGRDQPEAAATSISATARALAFVQLVRQTSFEVGDAPNLFLPFTRKQALSPGTPASTAAGSSGPVTLAS